MVRRLPTLVFVLAPLLAAQPAPSEEQVKAAMSRAAAYFRTVATEGGYLWRYSADLHTRQGEGPATATQIWIQPPGTPTVGMAFLTAYRSTKDGRYLDAALAAADALVRGQLDSGGWDYKIEFDPSLRWQWSYRGAANGQKNISTLDDDNTQAALRFLMEVHRDRPGQRLKSAIDYGLQSLLDNQYPNGAFPQRYPAPAAGYYSYYTFNDNTIADTVDTLILAHRLYGDERYIASVRRAGGFILGAQLPEPQPAWAQQYTHDMKPAWARKFEPPSVCTSESAGVIHVLMAIHAATGDDKYLKPIPAALAWFRRSAIAPGRWARFYELKTNRPLYFTRKYELTFADSDLPTHYSFQGPMGVERVAAAWENYQRTRSLPARGKRPDAPEIGRIVSSLDEKGRWLVNGEVRAAVFAANITALAESLRR